MLPSSSNPAPAGDSNMPCGRAGEDCPVQAGASSSGKGASGEESGRERVVEVEAALELEEVGEGEGVRWRERDWDRV